MKWSQGLTHQLSASQHCHFAAQHLHVFQLVGDEDDRHALFGKLSQRLEQLVLLPCADARSGLVQDKDARPEPEQAQDLQLLPFADRQRIDVRFGIEGKVKLRGQFMDLTGDRLAVREEVRQTGRGGNCRPSAWAGSPADPGAACPRRFEWHPPAI